MASKFSVPSWAAKTAPTPNSAFLEVNKKGQVLSTIDIRFGALGAGWRPYRLIGRNGQLSDVVLDNSSVSRQHAAVVHHTDGTIRLIDLGSAHGTRVNGSYVSANDPVELKQGDQVKFGSSSTMYVVHLQGGDTKAMSPPKEAPTTARLTTMNPPTEATTMNPPPEATTMNPPPEATTMNPPAAVSTTKHPPTPANNQLPNDPEDDASLRAQVPMAFGNTNKRQANVATQRTSPTSEAPEQPDFSAFKRPEASNTREQRRLEIEAMTKSMLDKPATFTQTPEEIKHQQDMEKEQREFEHEKQLAEQTSELDQLCDQHRFPISHQVELRGHGKTVSGLDVDPSGSRVASGSYDYSVRLWDFGGMDKYHRAFREFTPQDGYPVVSISYSSRGGHFLAAPASAKVRVFDRDGAPFVTTVKGDPYIYDMAKTKGHVGAVTCARWNPKQRHMFASCGVDGTCRIWDVHGEVNLLDSELLSKTVIKAKSARNTRIGLKSCEFNREGTQIACAAQDGSLQLWNIKTGGKYNRPNITIRPAHSATSDISCICFSPDDRYMASRGGGDDDDTAMLWDLRKAKTPVKTFTGLYNQNEQTAIVFSPNGQFLLTGTTRGKSGHQTGDLVFLPVSTPSVEPVVRTVLSRESSVVGLKWHDKLNQIVAGCGDGKIRVLYNPSMSAKGAMLSATRVTEKRKEYVSSADFASDAAPGVILNPSALPMYQDQVFRNKRKQQEKIRNDPVLTRIPAMPGNGPTAAGATGPSNFTTTLLQAGVKKKNLRAQDPREELLKYAEGAEKDGFWVNNAYKETQPKQIFHSQTMEEEEVEIKKRRTDLDAYKKSMNQR